MSKENAKKYLRFIAKECGQFSKEDLEEAMQDMQGGASPELNDEELKNISGGMFIGDGAGAPVRDQHQGPGPASNGPGTGFAFCGKEQ